MQYSQYHIDGWLTDYECVTDIEAVNDVLVLGSLLEGYTGEAVTLNEWGNPQLKLSRRSDYRTMRWYGICPTIAGQVLFLKPNGLTLRRILKIS